MHQTVHRLNALYVLARQRPAIRRKAARRHISRAGSGLPASRGEGRADPGTRAVFRHGHSRLRAGLRHTNHTGEQRRSSTHMQSIRTTSQRRGTTASDHISGKARTRLAGTAARALTLAVAMIGALVAALFAVAAPASA